MKKNRQNLLLLKGFFALGNALIGIFFPFLLMESFDLNFQQILLWDAAFFLAIVLFIYPLNAIIGKHFSQKQLLIGGLLSQAFFLICLSIGGKNPPIFFLATMLHIVFICLFWPHFNYKIQKSTDDSNRGNFGGNFQSILIGANIIAPIITGYFLEHDAKEYILFVAILFFFIAIYFSNKISIQEQKLSTKKHFFTFFSEHISKNTFIGIATDGIQSGLMWMIWPIYLKFVVLKFTLMGFVTSIAAVVEIFSAKIIGKVTDKYPLNRMKRIGIFSRIIDLSNRIWLWFFPSIWIVGGMTVAGAILGPIFQIPLMKKNAQIADQKDHQLDFWVWREIIINGARFLLLCLASSLFYFWGAESLWWLFGIVSLCLFGLWRY